MASDAKGDGGGKGPGFKTRDYKGFVAGIFSGIAKLTGKALSLDPSYGRWYFVHGKAVSGVERWHM